jgi:ADP-ribosyl-[dinitrogen reductase] hydrolase
MSAPPSFDRHAGCLLGVACGDALGGCLEFSRRDARPRVTEMLPNPRFGLPAGCWTDDTSMALCLAESLAASAGADNPADQLARYCAWMDGGHLSVNGECFDVGATVRTALRHHKERGALVPEQLAQPQFRGNGSLMRVAPCAMARFDDPAAAFALGAASSSSTHPERVCVAACGVYCHLVALALQGADKPALLAALTSFTAAVPPELRDVAAAAFLTKRRADIKSSGYVVHTLEAALWAFFTTPSFEEGAVLAVNLADDADSVGAVYGGVAGAHYGLAAIPPRWLAALQGRELLNRVFAQLWSYAVPGGAAQPLTRAALGVEPSTAAP